nr:queuosine salvage family protein [Archangium lipolyticum]
MLTLDAINFGSGWFPHLRKRPGASGYFTVAGGLTDHFRAHGSIPPERLAVLTAEDCAALFGQALTDEPIRELMGLFARSLSDLGRFLLERFSGRFTALVEAAGHSAERLVASLAEMPLYRDVARYGDFEVPFYKRAQITVTDLALAFGAEGWGRFDDLERLTAFADNLVPHVLRVDGVLEYSPALAERLDQGGAPRRGFGRGDRAACLRGPCCGAPRGRVASPGSARDGDGARPRALVPRPGRALQAGPGV